MQAVSAPRRLSDGNVSWDGIVTDITERRLAQEQLQAVVRDSKTIKDDKGRTITVTSLEVLDGIKADGSGI